MEVTRVGEVDLHLAQPVARPATWIGREDLMERLLACWTVITDDDLPLCPRVLGQPGMGKTTLAQAAAERMEKPVWIFQCTMDTRPEDLLVTPVLSESGNISYHASPLVTAILQGGVAILDEANRMSEKSWASLAPLLDNRRYVESVITGTRIDAHPDFRCCVTMNDDASTYEVPDYIVSRLQPMIEVGFPDRDDELRILQYNVAFAPEDLLEMTTSFLQQAHGFRLGYSTRDGVNIMRYALKLSKAGITKDISEAFHEAVTSILGEGAEDFEARARGQFMLGNVRDLSQFFTTEAELGDDDVDSIDDSLDDY